MAKTPPGWLATGALAAELEVDRETVRSWAKRGMPHRRQGRAYIFHLSTCRAWLEKNRPRPGRRLADQPIPTAVESEASPGLMVEAPIKLDDDSEGLSAAELGVALTRAKLQETKARAAKHEFDLAVKKREFLPIAEVRDLRIKRIEAVKAGLLGLAGKLPPQLVGCDEAEIAAVIDEEIKRLLLAFSRGDA